MTTPKTFDRYEIKRQLGKGGMATVYLAYDDRFERDVALKVLPPEFLHEETFRARFFQEAKTIASLEHPAIVPVYDFGEDHRQPFIVMRLMSGGTLGEKLQSGPLPFHIAQRNAIRIAEALHFAHQAGIVHRDLKPDNILFDKIGNPHLSDFGIAKIVAQTQTLTKGIIGTPQYMSPEQWRAKVTLDGRCDQYALGIILYQMLTANLPFHANETTGYMLAHINEPVPDVTAKMPASPEGIDTFIQKSMAKSRDERYPDMIAWAQALSAIEGGAAVQGGRRPAGNIPVIGSGVHIRDNEEDPTAVLPSSPGEGVPSAGQVTIDDFAVPPASLAPDSGLQSTVNYPPPKPKPESQADPPQVHPQTPTSARPAWMRPLIWIVGILAFACVAGVIGLAAIGALVPGDDAQVVEEGDTASLASEELTESGSAPTDLAGIEPDYLAEFDFSSDWPENQIPAADGSGTDVVFETVSGVYQVAVFTNGGLYWSKPGPEFGDGIYELDIRVTGGSNINAAGLVFGFQEGREDFYYFEVGSDGRVAIGQCLLNCDDARFLVGDDLFFFSNSVNRGLNVWNNLRVEAIGGTFIYYINGEEVGRVTGEPTVNGGIGVVVESFEEGEKPIIYQIDNVSFTRP